jgi:hypothetical protein
LTERALAAAGRDTGADRIREVGKKDCEGLGESASLAQNVAWGDGSLPAGFSLSVTGSAKEVSFKAQYVVYNILSV